MHSYQLSHRTLRSPFMFVSEYIVDYEIVFECQNILTISSFENQAGGLDKLTLDSLYDDAMRKTSQTTSYNPWEPAPLTNPMMQQPMHDPFFASNVMAAPHSVQMAAMANHQQAFLLQQQQQQQQQMMMAAHQHQMMAAQQHQHQMMAPQQHQMPQMNPFGNTYPTNTYGPGMPTQTYNPYTGML